MLSVFKKIFSFSFALFISGGGNKTETFIFEFGSSNVIVTSAAYKQKTYNVIIKNRMLTPLKARLESLDMKKIIPISVPEGKDRTFKLQWDEQLEYRLLPLSPPFEEISLEIGKDVYEIPPKK